MNGARLQSNGQVRNFPYFADESYQITVQWSTAAPTILARSSAEIVNTRNLPFDKGPDKSGRLFMVLNGYSIIVKADAFTPTAPQVSGYVYFRTNEGKRILLASPVQIFNSLAVGINSDRLIAIPSPLFAGEVTTLGFIEWVNENSVNGSMAGNNNMVVTLNIAFYGDYAEPNWNCMHNDIHTAVEKLHPYDYAETLPRT